MEVKLKSLKFTALSDSEYGIREVVSILEPMSVLPSFIVQHEDMWVLQTKIKGAENNWSNVISIDGCEMPDGSLVKVTSGGFSFPYLCLFYLLRRFLMLFAGFF